MESQNNYVLFYFIWTSHSTHLFDLQQHNQRINRNQIILPTHIILSVYNNMIYILNRLVFYVYCLTT